MGTMPSREQSEARLAAARATWPQGPWTTEPDRVEWVTRAGLPGLIVRSPLGPLCGYVAVPPGHPAHGKDEDAFDLRVHGGITYASECAGVVCHVPAPGEPDDVWWFGFDCAHAFDSSPLLGIAGSEYRDIAYVTAEVENLAAQLAALSG